MTRESETDPRTPAGLRSEHVGARGFLVIRPDGTPWARLPAGVRSGELIVMFFATETLAQLWIKGASPSDNLEGARIVTAQCVYRVVA